MADPINLKTGKTIEPRACDIVGGGSNTTEFVINQFSVNFNKAVLFVVIAVALFYPPMATPFWQTVLVSVCLPFVKMMNVPSLIAITIDRSPVPGFPSLSTAHM